MYDTEREHMDYEAGCQSEPLNCLAEARQRMGDLAAVAARDIDAMVRMGLAVVVARVPYWCRSTDAFAGEYLAPIRHFESKRQAMQWADTEGVPEDYHGIRVI